MLTSIARIVRPAAVGAALFGVYVYAAPEQAQLARSTVLAATGGGAAGNVANDCERPSACRASATPYGRVLDGQDNMLDVLASTPKSVCMLQDGMGEAAVAGDVMIARAYNGGVVEDFGATNSVAKN